jgi:hypothetical protein
MAGACPKRKVAVGWEALASAAENRNAFVVVVVGRGCLLEKSAA